MANRADRCAWWKARERRASHAKMHDPSAGDVIEDKADSGGVVPASHRAKETPCDL